MTSSIVLPDIFNGTVAVGIAASSDTVTADKDKLFHPAGADNGDGSVQAALSKMTFDRDMDPVARELMAKAAAWVIKNRMQDRNGGTHSNADVLKNAENTADDINALLRGSLEIGKVVTLLFASKLNYLMLNHHVGTSRIDNHVEGYGGKVLNAFGLAGVSGIRTALWRCGHWLDTRRAFTELGFTSVKHPDGYTKRDLLTISDDMSLRLAGGVAGAAKFLVHKAVLDKAKITNYSVLLPIEMDLDEAEELHNKIKANPLAYHMGAKFLINEERTDCDIFSENDKITLAAFCHAVMEGSTLSKAATLMDKAEVTASEVYTNCQALKIAMIKSVNTDVVLTLLKSKGVGSDNLAVKSGKFTLAEIDEAKAKVAT